MAWGKSVCALQLNNEALNARVHRSLQNNGIDVIGCHQAMLQQWFDFFFEHLCLPHMMGKNWFKMEPKQHNVPKRLCF